MEYLFELYKTESYSFLSIINASVLRFAVIVGYLIVYLVLFFLQVKRECNTSKYAELTSDELRNLNPRT